MKRVYIAIAFAALAVRGAALVPNPTPDACEYQMLARSIVRGDGFTLPVRVRHVEPGPVRHDARSERAPLFPLLLAPFDPVLDKGATSVAPGLQVVNALVGVACVLLVAQIAFGSSGSKRVALAAGAFAALSPPLVQTSTRLLAEPLGLLLILAAIRFHRAGVVGALLALARLARPEAAAASIWMFFQKKGERPLARAVLAYALITVVALLLGVGAPQSFLLRVSNFRQVMFEAPKPLAPSALAFLAEHPALVFRLIRENALDLGYFALRYGHAVPIFGLLALRRRDQIATTAFALALAAACVWSTRDHVRFLVAPLALLAIPATIEARTLFGKRCFEVFFLVSVAALGWTHVRYASKPQAQNPVWSVPETLAARLRALGPGEAFAAVNPWSLSLASGRDGLLLPVDLPKDALVPFLRQYPEVKVVVLRDAPHDDLTPEPRRYAQDLAPIASNELVGDARLLWLERR
jgi:hypothetical protein